MPAGDIAAIVLLAGFERTATVSTTPSFNAFAREDTGGADTPVEILMQTEARVIEMTIGDMRRRSRSGGA